jgi:hypothetical protein
MIQKMARLRQWKGKKMAAPPCRTAVVDLRRIAVPLGA